MINENIERLMYQSGRVEIDNFNLMVHNFYKDNKSFTIIPINYVIYDKDYVVYNPELRCFINHPQFRSITEFRPCLIGDEVLPEFEKMVVKVPGIIKKENLNLEINNSLPPKIRLLSDREIECILGDNGYKSHHFICNYDEENNISYKVYGKPIIKGKSIFCDDFEYVMHNLLDFSYVKENLLNKGIIDATSYPNRIPEDFIIESLNKLVISGKIKPQYVKFVIPLDDNNIYVTDYLYEYRLFERRFVLYEIPYGINANLTYWLEVEPNQTFTKTLKRVK